MKKSTILLASMLLTFGLVSAQPYLNNKAPLKAKNYRELPLGSIRAKGWLYEMLLSQKNGSTGALNELYPEVMGERNGWLGGDGDQWERGPYWNDGLLPLAYILDDKELQKKFNPGLSGPSRARMKKGILVRVRIIRLKKDYSEMNSRDWWPKMVMIKVLQQYYSATR